MTPTTKQKRVADGAAFLEWLEEDSWEPRTLLNLCYFGFGRGRESMHPAHQLLSKLPPDGNWRERADRLAKRIASILRAHATLELNHPGGWETVLQLLNLSSELRSRDELAAPLYWVYEACLQENIALPEKVRGALLLAIINNQDYEPDFRYLWRKMVVGEMDSILGGTRELGFRGLLMRRGRSKPDGAIGPENLKEIGWALGELAAHYALEVSTRRQNFRRMVNMAMHIWSISPLEMIQIADKARWAENGHDWAVCALPHLESFGALRDGDHGALVWHWFVEPLISTAKIKIFSKFCGDRIYCVKFPENLANRYASMIVSLENVRGWNADMSEHEALCHIYEEMKNLIESDLKSEPKVANELTKTANQVKESASRLVTAC